MRLDLKATPLHSLVKETLDPRRMDALNAKLGEYEAVINGVLHDDAVTTDEAMGKLLPLFDNAHAQTDKKLRTSLLGLLGDAMGRINRSDEASTFTGLVGRLEQLATGDFDKLRGEIVAKGLRERQTMSALQKAGEPNMGYSTKDPLGQLFPTTSPLHPYSAPDLTRIASIMEGEHDPVLLIGAARLKPLEGRTLEAKVVGVTKYGIDLKTVNPEARFHMPIQALTKAFGEPFRLSEHGVQLEAGVGGRAFALGQALEVVITHVDTQRGLVDALPVARAGSSAT